MYFDCFQYCMVKQGIKLQTIFPIQNLTPVFSFPFPSLSPFLSLFSFFSQFFSSRAGGGWPEYIPLKRTDSVREKIGIKLLTQLVKKN